MGRKQVGNAERGIKKLTPKSIIVNEIEKPESGSNIKKLEKKQGKRG